MGMFDFLRYEGKEYQFKDFDPYMHLYEITPEKRLIRKSRFKAAEGGGLEYEEVIEDTNHHGYIHAITGREDNYQYYRFKFTDGLLVSVEPIEDMDVP